MSKVKKVLIVIGSFKIGGAERMAVTIGSQLLKDNYDVHFVLIRPIFQIPHEIDPARIHVLHEHTGRSSMWQHILNLYRIFALNLKLRADVVIGFTYFSSFLACFTFCKYVIGTFDVFPYQFIKKRRLTADFILYWPFVRKIICPSFGLLEQVARERKGITKKGMVIYNTLDFDSLIQKSEEMPVVNAGWRNKYIVAMGRFTRQKNFPLLLNAYAQSSVKEQYDLVIIGDGAQKQEYLDIILKLGIQNKVFLTGFLNNPFPIVKKASFLVNTSNYESFCVVILESLALSVPVIATNCKSGPAELINDSFNGFLVPVGDIDSLVTCLEKVRAHNELINEFKKNTVASIEKFKIESIITEWIQLFNDR